jgi:hypothetical protein
MWRNAKEMESSSGKEEIILVLLGQLGQVSVDIPVSPPLMTLFTFSTDIQFDIDPVL